MDSSLFQSLKADLAWLKPEMILAGGAMLVLAADLAWRRGAAWVAYTLGLLSLGWAGCSVWRSSAAAADAKTALFHYVTLDGPARYGKLLVLLVTSLVLLISWGHRHLKGRPQGEYVSLILMAALSMSLVISASNLLMIYLAIEFLGIASYILVSFLKKDLRSSEAALKYLLVGAVSSAFMLYGMTFIYGIYGTLNLYGIRGALDLSPAQDKAVMAALVLLLVGFGFKIAMVPFHAWTPDVYEGAPTPITAFISVAPKIAGFLVLFRVFSVAFPPHEFSLRLLAGFLSAVTMTVGNLSAMHQLNVKRLLAFSTISHVGYMLMGFASGTTFGFQAVLVYLGAYSLMNLGAFAIVIQVSNRYGSDTLTDFAGLSKKSLPTALGLAFVLLSLAGIPPTVGFIGKWFVFSAALSSGLWPLAVIGALNAVVALYYYFRIVHQMFFQDPNGEMDVSPGYVLSFTVAFTVLATILFGVLPQGLFSITEAAAKILGTL